MLKAAMEDNLGIDFPSQFPVKTESLGEIEFDKNISFILSNYDEVTTQSDQNYEQFLADIWVGIILTLMVLSCVCCMCSCLLYHKFQQWKRSVIQARNAANLEAGSAESELPSYTIASGLPSYDEALEQLKKVKELNKGASAKTNDNWVPRTPPTPIHTLSVRDLFQIYTRNNSVTENQSGSTFKPS